MDFIDTISFGDVIAYMDSGQPFSFSFVTSDKKRGTGGEWISLKWAVKHMLLKKGDAAEIAILQPISVDRRDPNHFENSTRNVKLKNGEIRKVHLRLIRVFNNKTVL